MGWSNRPTGVTHYDPPHAYRGYTLFSANGGDDAYLVDMEGRFVHRWRKTRYNPGKRAQGRNGSTR